MKIPRLPALVFALPLLSFAAAGVPSPLDRLPLHFEPAPGEAASGVEFVARTGGYSVGLGSTNAVLNLPGMVVELRWLDAGSGAGLSPEDPLPGKSHYFLGRDPEGWRTNVPQFASVRRRDLYPDIDVVYYGNGRKLEFDLVLAPGADPGRVRLGYSGVAGIRLADGGDLLLEVPGGELRQLRPRIYQDAGGERREIAGSYVLHGEREIRFQVGEYDPALPLVIDPVIVYSTYLGGDGIDMANAIAVDSGGHVYVTGQTHSLNFPVSGYQNTSAFEDPPGQVFVTKLNPAGTAIVYSAYFGGRRTDYGTDIALDVEGYAYVTGFTQSEDFPTTAGAYQPALNQSASRPF